MNRIQQRTFALLVAISIIYFLIMLWPNFSGAKDPVMVSIFEPDEAAQLPHVMRMVIPANHLIASLRNFFFYQHYYYGFPFYFISAIFALLPVKVLAGLGSMSVNMLALRQVTSVLPITLAGMVLVYLQTRFQRALLSAALLVFLLFIPAVFQNSTWWHPDSLLLLFISLTFFFLDRDDLSFGNNFYFAALTCGLATATKLVGLFFFLTIPIYILIGMRQKHLTIWQAARVAIYFLAIMFVTFVISNPFLLDPEQRFRAFRIQSRQAEAMSQGWNVLYSRGPIAWYPRIAESYGHITFILLAFLVSVLCIWRDHRRLLNILILSFVIPFVVYVFSIIVIKPSHFLLPAALPLFSSLAGIIYIVALPKRRISPTAKPRNRLPSILLIILSILVIGYQLFYNFRWDVNYYWGAVNKEKDSAEIQFFSELKQNYLTLLPNNGPHSAFRDVRIYFPETSNWLVDVRTKMATYEVIQEGNYDLVVMWNQRAMDYTNENVIEEAIDPDEMRAAYRFYSDVREMKLDGYALLYRTNCCSAFLRQSHYDRYFKDIK